jgi:hypothetical protein
MALKRFLYVGVVAIGLVGCAGGSVRETEDDGGSTTTGQQTTDFNYRQLVSIEGAVPEGYSIPVPLDHAALVKDGKALPTGDDVRVFFESGNDKVELNRVLDIAAEWDTPTTVIWFRTQPDPEMTGQYYVYYGSPNAGAAPDDASQVFDIFDGFDDTAVDEPWITEPIGSAMGYALESNGVVRVTGETGAVGSVADSCMFMHREISGSFIAEAKIMQVGGNRGAASKLGGLMIRQGTAEEARNISMSIRENPKARISSVRASDAGDTVETEFAGGDPFPQLVAIQRQGVSVAPQYSEDGKTWVGLGSPGSVTFADPVQIGIPFANVSAGEGWVEMDWIRVRKLALPEPTVSVGDEQSI